MKKILTGAALFFCAASFAAEWKYTKAIDEMTDETIITFSSRGTILDEESAGIYFYEPTLYVSFRGDAGKGFDTFVPHPALSIALAKFDNYDRTTVTTRFGKGKPQRHLCSLADERRCAVLPVDFGRDLLTNDTVLVRFTRVGETVDDVRFDLTGIRPAIEEARRVFFAPKADPSKPADRPKQAKPAKPTRTKSSRNQSKPIVKT